MAKKAKPKRVEKKNVKESLSKDDMINSYRAKLEKIGYNKNDIACFLEKYKKQIESSAS